METFCFIYGFLDVSIRKVNNNKKSYRAIYSNNKLPSIFFYRGGNPLPLRFCMNVFNKAHNICEDIQ